MFRILETMWEAWEAGHLFKLMGKIPIVSHDFLNLF